ncbi:MAG: elongation factor P maturation arginine rhamnosyltransferase EarP, partial [Fusobacteriaceae bacterium]
MLSFDIFCEVIDNFGDIGVVYRFANELLKRYNSQNKEIKIRVFLDKTCELTALDNKATEIGRQTLSGIEFITFDYLEKNKSEINPSEVIIEAFGYNLPSWYLEKAKSSSSLLINLEYLSSEDWTLDFHLKESLIGAPKLRKFFFMPGLSPELGGVIIPSA